MTTATHPAWELTTPDLHGKTVVVVGGSGGVGEGVVRTLLDDGATVVATGRDQTRLDDLRRNVIDAETDPRLHTEILDASAPDLDAQIEALATTYGTFDGVVVTVASWGNQGRRPALSLNDDEWQHLLDANLTTVFRLFRGFLPHTSRNGMILQLNGMSADIPFPGAAAVALSAAASKSLTRTIAAELDGRGPRFYQVILGVVRTRARQSAGVDDLNWLDGEEVGAHVAALVAGTSPLVDTTVHYLTDKRVGPQTSPEPR